MRRVAVAEVLDLPFNVFFLMRRADSGLGDVFLLVWLVVIVTKFKETFVHRNLFKRAVLEVAEEGERCGCYRES